MFKNCQFWECFWQCFLPIFILKTLSETFPKLTKLKNLDYLKKLVSNFCLIGKICHNFLVPTMIELGCQTFMPIQTLDLHRVICPIYLWNLWMAPSCGNVRYKMDMSTYLMYRKALWQEYPWWHATQNLSEDIRSSQ